MYQLKILFKYSDLQSDFEKAFCIQNRCINSSSNQNSIVLLGETILFTIMLHNLNIEYFLIFKEQ